MVCCWSFVVVSLKEVSEEDWGLGTKIKLVLVLELFCNRSIGEGDYSELESSLADLHATVEAVSVA